MRGYPGIVAVLLAVLLVPGTVFSGWVAVYGFTATLDPRAPPVVFSGSGNPYVTAVFSPNATVADVNVTIPNQYIITLVSRSMVYWNDFSADPFSTGSMYVVSGAPGTNWYWSSSGYVVLDMNQTLSTAGGEAIALFNFTMPANYTAVYVEYSFQIATGTGWADLIHYENTTGYFYTSGLYYGGILTQYLTIYKYNGTWNGIASTSITAYRGVWYDLTVVYNSTGTITIYSGTTELLQGNDTQIVPDAFGFGGYYGGTGTLTVYFDNVTVSINRPPYTVTVTGLQYGWTVNIYGSSGNLLATGTADTTGTATLDFWQYRFVPNATIEVLDSNGALVARQTFDWVLGGDVYQLTNPVADGVTLDILDYVSNDLADTYYTSLELIGYTVVSGNFTSCSFYLESGGVDSTAMDVLLGQTSTGEIPLYPGYTGKIYMYVLGTANSTLTVDLYFRYREGPDTVLYTVRVTVYYGV